MLLASLFLCSIVPTGEVAMHSVLDGGAAHPAQLRWCRSQLALEDQGVLMFSSTRGASQQRGLSHGAWTGLMRLSFALPAPHCGALQLAAAACSTPEPRQREASKRETLPP